MERGIERELPRLIGPAQSYEVEIEGLRARTGEAERVVAVQTLAVRFDVEPAQLEAQIAELRTKHPKDVTPPPAL